MKVKIGAHSPLKGMTQSGMFVLSLRTLDPKGIIVAMEIRVGDLLAASALELLCRGLKGRGFPFSPSSTGFGPYAGATCTLAGLVIHAFVSRDPDRTPREGEVEFELQVGADRIQKERRFGLQRSKGVDPSDAEASVWRSLMDGIQIVLESELDARSCSWNRS